MRQGSPHAGWRYHLKENEDRQVRQIDAEIDQAIRTILRPLQAERKRFMMRARMRMLRAKRLSQGESVTTSAA